MYETMAPLFGWDCFILSLLTTKVMQQTDSTITSLKNSHITIEYNHNDDLKKSYMVHESDRESIDWQKDIAKVGNDDDD